MCVGWYAVCFTPSLACADESVILSVTLNSISHGELFLKRNEDGTILMRSEDARKIGLKTAAVAVKTIEGEPYISLKDLAGVAAVLDEKRLTLDLRAGAAWVDLPRVVRNYSPPSGTYVPPLDTTAFLNYRMDFGTGNDVPDATWSTTGQAGMRRGNILLLSDGFYQRTRNTQQAVRLMSNLSWDRPGTLSRWVAGDIHASAGEPSGPIIMGGIGYASAFSMSPGLNTYPVGEFGGVATLPSDAEIYINGVLARREHLAPGEYRFQNLPVSNGANNVDIIMRDSFGNETRNSTRFYLSDTLLKAGLHDYSYNIGFMRQGFGSASNQYGRPLLVARHSFGVNNAVTLGAGGEADIDFVNLTPRVVVGLAGMGVVSLLGGESHDRVRGSGSTFGAGYRFQSRYINYQGSLSHNTAGYRTLVNRQAGDTARLDGRTAVSLGNSSFGTVSLNGSFIETYAGLLRRSLGASYSRSLTKKIQFSATWNSSWGTSGESTFFAGLTFFPMQDLTVSASLQSSAGSDKETVSLQKNLPAGEGLGYQATVERERVQDRSVVRANPYFQANGPYGSYTADIRGESDQQNGQTTNSLQISAAGAVVYANGHVGLSRPVSGSFAVVQVEGLAGVRVLLDNQEVAQTNANGMAYIPTLRSYQENLIAFDDTRISPDYLIKRYSAIVTPGLFGGECISFPVARVQSYGGRLLAENGTPLEYAELVLQGMGHAFTVTTLSGGEFYFENMIEVAAEAGNRSARCDAPSPYRQMVVPGTYAATAVSNGSERHFTMLIPSSDELFVPLGTFRLPDAAALK